MFFDLDPHPLRRIQHQAFDISDEIHRLEGELIELLRKIDCGRYYVKYGYKSLKPFIITGLRFNRTQAQRLMNILRRSGPTVSLGNEREVSASPEHMIRPAEEPLERKPPERKFVDEDEPFRPIDVDLLISVSGVRPDS